MVREALESDLNQLLQLYAQLHNNPVSNMDVTLLALWSNILNDKNHHIILAIEKNMIVSSCVLIVIPNLTHNQRPYALVENVITDSNYRNKGFATACLSFAKDIAKKNYCYKIMLLTGSKQESTLGFYERSGYNRNDKTAFIQWL